MAREVMGTMTCPECGGAAEVKKQKNGLAYRWCMDCHAQYFPRSAEASDRLLAKCGAAKPAAPVPEPAPKADPVTVTPLEKKTAAPKATPPAPPKAAHPFDILGQFRK